ncbi:MAG: glycoside hydrolase family 3 N-terminal domain-containing protein [Terracidiphilus sp.]|jgi:beta-N-acetylhexosaminidase
MKENLRRTAGSLLVVGLGGTELTNLERGWLKLVRPGGIILFRRNIADARQARALLGEATGLCATNSFRCVDVEGGTVDRLRDALAPMPSAQAVAQAALRSGWDRWSPTLSVAAATTREDGAPSSSPRSQRRDLGHPTEHPMGLACEHGELVARGVKAFGFNTTLAPVLDLALPASAEVLGTRAAAATATGVVEYARPFLAGLAGHGVVGCGKHFPGLGGGALDSHLETPAIRRSSGDLWREDLAPYRELRGELPMVMVSHAAYPDTPGKDRPASVSPYWIAAVLRKRIGYREIVLSDDLEMGGILKFMPIEEAAVAAIRAGMDLLEICHSPELILRAFEALIAEGERSAAFSKLLMGRAEQVTRQRAKLFAGGVPKALSSRQFEALRARILRFSEAVEKAQPTAEAQPA